ncbi:MAG TPA: PEP-CTERM sorting domain-containing protein [Tepidisphaeraceae bacterium]|nr:PEP-CTERM sorting domain-containing protein [Tepidisphaeraceae bacterium]
MRIRLILAASAGLGLAGSAFGAFTLNNGNATFTMLASASSLFPTSNLSGADFRPEGGATTDQMFYYNWGVRQPGFSNAGLTAAGASSITESGTGTDTYTHTIINGGTGPAGQSRYDAVTTIRLTDGALPGAARLDSTLVFTASQGNAGPVTYQLFHIVDNDFNGSLNNDQFNVTDTTAVRGTVVDTLLTAPAVFGEFEGLGASRYEVSGSSTIRSRINGGIVDLNNSASFLGDGGYGFQWTVTLAPGESYTARSSYNLVVPEPATAGLLITLAPAFLRRRR